jgi:predicted nucleotide-binding protein
VFLRSYVLTNIQAYIYGCRFAIAVFERILTNDLNPNVSLEVGYFLGLKKPVCLLKEPTLPRLPSDLIGRLYVEFDGQDLPRSLPRVVGKWLTGRGLIRNGKA